MLKGFPAASATVAYATKLPPDSTFGVHGLLPRSFFGSAFSRARQASLLKTMPSDGRAASSPGVRG
jgi:hypothetical protein